MVLTVRYSKKRLTVREKAIARRTRARSSSWSASPRASDQKVAVRKDAEIQFSSRVVIFAPETNKVIDADTFGYPESLLKSRQKEELHWSLERVELLSPRKRQFKGSVGSSRGGRGKRRSLSGPLISGDENDGNHFGINFARVLLEKIDISPDSPRSKGASIASGLVGHQFKFSSETNGTLSKHRSYNAEIELQQEDCEIDFLVDATYNYLFPREMDEPGSMGEARGERIKTVLQESISSSNGLSALRTIDRNIRENDEPWFTRVILKPEVLTCIVQSAMDVAGKQIQEGTSGRDGQFVDIPELFLLSALMYRFSSRHDVFAEALMMCLADFHLLPVSGIGLSKESVSANNRVGAHLRVVSDLLQDIVKAFDRSQADRASTNNTMGNIDDEGDEYKSNFRLEKGLLLDSLELVVKIFLSLWKRASRLIRAGCSVDLIRSLNRCLAQLTARAPVLVLNRVMGRMLRAWPPIEDSSCLLYLELFDTFLHLFPVELVSDSHSFVAIFERLTRSLQSPNSQHVRRTIALLGAPHIILNFISRNETVLRTSSTALYLASREHWCSHVRDGAEELFDSLLDFA